MTTVVDIPFFVVLAVLTFVARKATGEARVWRGCEVFSFATGSDEACCRGLAWFAARSYEGRCC